MEQFDNLTAFGKHIKDIRNEMGLTQVEFYRYIYPEDNNDDYNLKKQMNKIERGKRVNLKADFIIRVCKTCNVSADYLFGLSTDFRNHETEFIHNYTGLDEIAIKQLHKWNNDKNNGVDTSMIEEAFFAEEAEEHMKMYAQQDGIAMLKIVNYLFKSGKRKNRNRKGKTERYSNLGILRSLYLMSMAKPERLEAHIIPDEYLEFLIENNKFLYSHLEPVNIDLKKTITLVDNDKTHYCFDPKETLERIGRDNLNRGVDWLIEQVKNDEKQQ